jgi:hypothetical protein
MTKFPPSREIQTVVVLKKQMDCLPKGKTFFAIIRAGNAIMRRIDLLDDDKVFQNYNRFQTYFNTVDKKDGKDFDELFDLLWCSTPSRKTRKKKTHNP